MSLKTRFLLSCWHLADNLRYSPTSRAGRACIYWIRARLARDPVERIRNLAVAFGLAESVRLGALLWLELKQLLVRTHEPSWRRVVETTSRYARMIKSSPHLSRSIVLKEPGVKGEKGVLLNYFEYNLARVLSLSDVDLLWLDDRFHLIFVASWSPTDYALLGSAALRLKSPLFVQCANEAERLKISTFHPNIICLPGLACDWVDPTVYEGRPMAAREIDLLMVANWGVFKRHWEFFEALRALPDNLRVVLVGQKEGGRTMSFIRDLACRLGVRQKVELIESLPIDQVTRLQCNARVSVILSRREGGCVAAVESLFAGCALAMREDAHIGSAAHINEQTGRRLRPGFIAQDLALLLNECVTLSPEVWAQSNIANSLTLQRIEDFLRQHVVCAGQPWTQGLIVPRWRPHPTLVTDEDRVRLRPVYEMLHQRLSGIISTDLADISHR